MDKWLKGLTCSTQTGISTSANLGKLIPTLTIQLYEKCSQQYSLYVVFTSSLKSTEMEHI